MAWANIYAHDQIWTEYVVYVNEANGYAAMAKADTAAAQRAGCF